MGFAPAGLHHSHNSPQPHSLPQPGKPSKTGGKSHRHVAKGQSNFDISCEFSPESILSRTTIPCGCSLVAPGFCWSPGQADTVVGFIALRDEPNPTAHEALHQLHELNIKRTLLSGDNPQTTAAIAAELGLDEYEGNMQPSEKAARISTWQQAEEQVAMVGDGVNDAPALAQADLSFTVAGGADVAGETSDVILTKPDLTLVPWFITRSRRTRRIILENLGWAFAYNLLAVPLAAFGVISPVIAAVAMAASSLLVVGNSLRLQH